MKLPKLIRSNLLKRSQFTKEDIDKFLSFVPNKPADGCWEWGGSFFKSGYGYISIGKKCLYAHRVSAALHFGEVPAGFEVAHVCDVPKCVRPSHLVVCSHKENMEDASLKGRIYKHDMAGEKNTNSKLTSAIVLEIRNRHSKGEMQRDLAKEFGVVKTTMSHIITRRNWKHLP